VSHLWFMLVVLVVFLLMHIVVLMWLSESVGYLQIASLSLIGLRVCSRHQARHSVVAHFFVLGFAAPNGNGDLEIGAVVLGY
jgi:hypothetical protein